MYFFCDPFKFNVESFGFVTKICDSFINTPLTLSIYLLLIKKFYEINN